MYLTRDIYSNFNGHQYGKAGDLVKEVADHGEVKIVETAKGLRFPVRVEYLTDQVGQIETGKWKPEINQVPAKKKGKTKQLESQTLF
jgi:hypothetical protein